MTYTKLLLKRKEVNKLIKGQAKKDKRIVYGSKAMNAQLHPYMRRHSPDYDIYSNKPKQDALKTEKKLDRLFGGNFFFVKPAIHSGTWKVMHIGLNPKDPKDDIGIADFSKGKAPFVRIGGIKYEKLSNIESTKKQIIKDPESEYRHDKDRTDLRRIRLSKGLKKRRIGI